MSPSNVSSISEACQHICQVLSVDFSDAWRRHLLPALRRGELFCTAGILSTYLTLDAKGSHERSKILPPEFWDRAYFYDAYPHAHDVIVLKPLQLDYSLEGYPFDTRKYYTVEDPHLPKSKLCELWPVRTSESETADPSPPPPNGQASKVATVKQVKEKALEFADGIRTEPEVRALVKAHFKAQGLRVSEKNVWRPAWKQVPQAQKRSSGEHDRTRQIRLAE